MPLAGALFGIPIAGFTTAVLGFALGMAVFAVMMIFLTGILSR